MKSPFNIREISYRFKPQKDEQTMDEIERFYPDENLGLISAQVKKREEAGLTNKKTADNSNTLGSIVRRNVCTYFNFVFFVFAVILILQKSYNHLAFFGVVFSNTIIGIIQEVRSNKMLSRLNLLSAPSSNVVRDGKVIRVNSDDIVLDDIIILEGGNQIPADGVVCSGEVTVNESLITGEPDEIVKVSGDKLLSGSFVVSGSCRARLERVGDKSFAARLMADAKKTKKRSRPGMMRALNILIILIGIIIVPFSVIMFYNQHVTLGLGTKESVESVVASAVGMIPEGLYLLTSIALASSTVRLAKGNTLVHDMKCIESLARVDVICVDKTGTVTSPDMEVTEVISACGNISANKEVIDKIRDMAFALKNENITLSAIRNYFKAKFDDNKESDNNDIKTGRVKEFSSALKYSLAELNETVYFMGAPELLKDEGTDERLQEHYEKGERVLAFGKIIKEADAAFKDNIHDAEIMPMAFIVLTNPVRENAKETFEYFVKQGVTVKVISGDNPRTVSAVAKEAGIQNAGDYIDVSALTDDEVKSSEMLKYTVFGRVSPDRKRLLIRNFKKAKHTVAMTGDGVNDVLALKDADCSIAMASGSEAAANVADLVLVNSDFANMPHVVNEGRRVINNIERSASLFLVKNIFSFIMTLISIFTVCVYPLKPVQISLSSALMIGIPSFFLALEPNENITEGKFLRNVLYRAMPSALCAVLMVTCTVLISKTFNINDESMSTISCLVYTFAGYMMLYKTMKPFNIFHGVLFVLMGCGYLAAIFIIPWFFDIANIGVGGVIITILLIIPAYPIQKGIEYLFNLVKNGKQA